MADRLQALRGDDGVTVIVVAILVVVLFGFVALAVDAGRMYEVRRELQRTADLAALSGAGKYAAGNTTTPGDPCGADALACANYYIDANPSAISPIDSRSVVVPTACSRVVDGTSYPCVHTEVTSSNFEYTFARVLGFDSRSISAQATAIVASGAPEGARLIPWLLMDCPEPSVYPDEAGVTGNDSCPYTYSADFDNGPYETLYESPGGGSRGNFDAGSWDPVPDCPATKDGLFGTSGGSDYFDFLRGTNSSQEPCAIDKGARMYTKPGFMGGPTDANLTQRNGSPGIDGCMNKGAFESAVEVTDPARGLVSITDYANPCLVAIPLVVHGDETQSAFASDTPGGCCVATLQHPDPAARLAGPEGRDLLLVRRFGLFYITERGEPGASFNYRGLFLKTVDSIEAGVGGTGCGSPDGICVVKLVE
jgi:Flp pilus assembly protein TadG